MSIPLRCRAPRRRRLPLVLAFCAVITSIAFVGPGPAEADPTSCEKPEGAFTTFTASFSNGTMQLASATATGLSAEACGSVALVPGQGFVSTVQPDNIAFGQVSVKLSFLRLPATVTVNEPIVGPVKIARGFVSADVTLPASITASTRLLGFECGIGPITPSLTTGASGALTGTTFTGSLAEGYTGRVVANDFAVPAIQPSSRCPWLIAKLSNLLVGLPADPGEASIEMDGTMKIG